MDTEYSYDKLSKSFQNLIENKELTLQLFDMFPIPIEIFSSDGISVYVNRAMMNFSGFSDPSLMIGKYNVIDDPVCNDQLGLRNVIQKAFRGEVVALSDFSPPIQDLVDRGVIEEKPFEAALMDANLYPIWNKDELAYVVCLFILKNMYQGKPEVAKAKEYIDIHWKDKFNSNAISKELNMSVSQLYNLFKQHVGMTMGEYYKQTKVSHIKEKLADKNLTVAEAFAACGENSRGTYARVFKAVTGFSPKEYRQNIKKGTKEKK